MASSTKNEVVTNEVDDDEEEDYMSDAFLAKCVQEDVRPGLKMSHATKREHETLKKKEEVAIQEAKEKSKRSKSTRQELEEEQRRQGLDTSLDQSNKGFAMLQKMGYKQGDSLGKDNQGRVEPIPIEVKADRSGLGREAAVQQISEAKAEFRRRHAEARARSAERQREMSAQEFRLNLARKNRSRQTESDLYTSQKTCHQLDTVKGWTEPVEDWFWPERTRVTDDADDIDAENIARDAEAAQAAEAAAAEAARDPKDPDEFGAFDSDEDEPRFREIPPAPQGNKSDRDHPEEDEGDEFTSEEKLQILTGYLRSQYNYCLWCGISYENSDELKASCPGPTREDHDD